MNKKKLALSLGSISAAVIPLTAIVSCNVDLRKNMKDNTISDSELVHSKEAKELRGLFQDEFQKKFLKNYYTEYFDGWQKYDRGSGNKWYKPALWDDTKGYFVWDDRAPMSPLVATADENQLTRAIQREQGTGNFAGNLVGEIENEVWKNKQIDKKVRGLLNNIRTVYNRTKQVYPIEQRIIEKNGKHYAKIVYQVDLLSTLSKRFMTHFMTLSGEVPLENPSDKLFRDEIFDFSDKFSNLTTSTHMLDNLYNWPERTRLVADGWFGANYLNVSAASPLQNFNDLEFVKVGSDYKLKYSKYDSASIDSSDGSFVGTKTDIFLKDNSGQEVTFSKTDTMETVKDALLSSMFIDNTTPYIKAMFTGANAWKPNIEIVNLAGSSIEGITIDDYLRNFMSSTQVGIAGIPYDRDMAWFNIYATREFKDSQQKDHLWKWRSLNNNLTTKLVKGDLL